jgi:hypothetical protein
VVIIVIFFVVVRLEVERFLLVVLLRLRGRLLFS